MLIFLLSCEDSLLIGVICEECKSSEPSETSLKIKLSKTNQYSGIIINIYEGNLEDNILLKSFEVTTKEITQTLPINKKYTVTATYFIGECTYIAVDSAFPRVKYDKSSCDSPCFWIYDSSVNVRLK